MQHWLAIKQRQNGHTVASNVSLVDWWFGGSPFLTPFRGSPRSFLFSRFLFLSLSSPLSLLSLSLPLTHSLSLFKVAPSTATVSVTHNFLFKMAYGGMHFFKPMEVMWPCTSNALMGALLLHDMSNESGPKRGAVGSDHFSNPLELFSTQGVHGGLWRTGYSLNSTGTLSAILYLLTNYRKKC